MKLVSLTVLHYGREWLEWALRAVYPFVDEMHVFYTPHPSHGHQQTRHKCPDSKEELHGIVSAFPTARWHETTQFYDEGPQRDYARDFCLEQGADLIVVVDADEVWDPDDLNQSIEEASGKPGLWKSRIKGNLWKGVNWVCRDELSPDRFISPGSHAASRSLRSSREPRYLSGPGFWHFGYAVSMQSMLYKLSIHGHKDELRKDWAFIYQNWKGLEDTPLDGVHPTNTRDSTTGKAFWVPEPFDRREIAHLVGDHPYFNDQICPVGFHYDGFEQEGRRGRT